MVTLKYTATLQGDSKEINQCWIETSFCFKIYEKIHRKIFKKYKIYNGKIFNNSNINFIYLG